MPRVKVVLARAARLVADGALALKAERTAELRSIAVDMIKVLYVYREYLFTCLKWLDCKKVALNSSAERVKSV